MSRMSAGGVDLAEHRRRLGDRHGARPERLDREPDFRKLLGAARSRSTSSRGQLHHLRDQEHLARHGAAGKRRLQPLVDDALVRGVLVDDDQPVIGLRDDVVRVKLRAGGAERTREHRSRRAPASAARASADGRSMTAKAACSSSPKPRGSAPPSRASRAAVAVLARRTRRRAASGRKAASVLAPTLPRGAEAVRRQRLADRADDEPAHQAGSRKRTSSFAGCTFTSNSAGSSSGRARRRGSGRARARRHRRRGARRSAADRAAAGRSRT